MTDTTPHLRLTVAPEPTDEEIAAITAILLTRRPRHVESTSTNPAGRPSRWAMAGRREAMRGVSRDQLAWVASTGKSA